MQNVVEPLEAGGLVSGWLALCVSRRGVLLLCRRCVLLLQFSLDLH